jgi:putative pyruvate formate lyase activating enzyme
MAEKHREASYLGSARSGALEEKIREAYAMMAKCRLCARSCDVDRTGGQKGFCGTGDRAVVSSAGPHFGEESPLVGTGGSGTIFLTSCNLRCLFCQNDDISHLKEGSVMSPGEIADSMCALQRRGCHNINFVTPSHQMPFLLEAVFLAAEKGLSVPIVWNCGGYESLEALQILDGIVDIYMPDFKFSRDDSAGRYCSAPDYPETARIALAEMHRQVGDLVINSLGIAERGLLVRHLVMPGDVCGTGEIVRWIAENLSRKTYVNIMAQYRPCYKASQFPEINRRITGAEYEQALQLAKEQGLRLDQDLNPRNVMRFLRDIF